ncbi:MAG: hypothetical protein RB148_09470 [Armatimonadota bacterium]|nr:hypothetical protein [Armatimonadota bacterium]
MNLTLSEFMGRTVEYRPELIPVPVDERLRQQVREGELIFPIAAGASFLSFVVLPPLFLLPLPVFLVSVAAAVAWWTLRDETQEFTLADPRQLELLSLLGGLAALFRACGRAMLWAGIIFTVLGVVILLLALGGALGGGR